MLPAHDVSGVHPLSCLSLSQRKAVPSPRQVQRLLGQSDGSGNLPGLHPFGSVTLINPSASPTARPLKFQSSFRHYPGAVVCPLPESCLSRSKMLIANLPFHPQGSHLQASTTFSTNFRTWLRNRWEIGRAH